MTFAVRYNTPTDGGGSPTFTPPAPAAAPEAPRLRTEADLRVISEATAGMAPPPFPLTAPVAVADPPALPNTPPVETPAAPATAPTSLTPMQAALQLLNSPSPESQRAGKELLDRIMANPQTQGAPPKPEIPAAPDWAARETQLRAEVENYFKETYKQPVIEDGKQLLDEAGNPAFRYPDLKRLDWNIKTELRERLREEKEAYNSKVNEVQSQFTEKQKAQELQAQWTNALGTTVKSTLLSTIFELIPDARTKTPQGQDGVKTDVFKKYERVARGIAKEVADSIDYDSPRYAGPNGLNAVMADVAQGIRTELASILPTASAPAATPLTAPFVAKPTLPPSTGAPLAPSAYQPPVPGQGTKSWEKQNMRPRERAEIGLSERMREMYGGNLPTPAL